MSLIPVMVPRVPRIESVRPYLERMDQAGKYSNFGPLVRALESRYATELHVAPDQVVTCSSATLALCGAVSVTDRSTWLVPNLTFPATGLAVLHAGRDLVLGPIDENNLWLDGVGTDLAREDIGVMPVAPFGAGFDLARWSAFSHVVLDAAASLGAWPSLANLPANWAVVFSLHATKVLPAVEGGVAVFGDASSAARFRAWTNFGFSGSRISQLAGTNAKMSEVHAAYGLASLDDWSREQGEWRRVHDMARQVSEKAGLLDALIDYSHPTPYWQLILHSKEHRVSLEVIMARMEIETRRWWPGPLSEMPAFANAHCLDDGTSTRAVADRLIALPMYRGLRVEHFERIGQAFDASGA